MPNINTKFSLSGEKEYKAAISQIGDGMRVLNSEMRKVESEYIKNADSVDALRAKSDIFSKKIGEQKEKIEITRKALEQATKAQEAANEKFQKAKDVLDEGSDEYKRLAQGVETATKKAQGWQVSLNNAEAELNKMNAELEENNDALEKAGANGTKFQQAMEKVRNSVAKAKEEGTGAKGIFANLKESFGSSKGEAVGLGDAIGGAADKLGIQLPEGASKALNSLNGISAGTAAVAGGFAAVAAAIVKTEKALIDMTKEAAEGAKEIETFASITGQSEQQVQQMQYASEKLGVSYDRVRDSLKEITNKMQEAENGSADTAAAFDKLKVSLRGQNGELRDAQDVFLDVIDALGNVENQSERDAIAMDLMSESAQELNPMIEAGRETIQQYAQAASDMGLVLEEDELKALTEVQSAFYDLEQQQKATKNQLAAEFAPYLTSFYSDMSEATRTFGQTLEDSGIVSAFGSLLEFVGELIDPTSVLGQTTLPILEDALQGVALVLATVVDSLRAIAGLLDGLADWIDTGSTQTWKDAFSFKATNAVLDIWDSSGSNPSPSRGGGSFSGGFGGGTSVTNNYYTVTGANARSVAQIEQQAQSARQTNRAYGGA
ncbi:MAG: hypothetical protein KH299_07745 [Firmicutes bacterium]|nr:hypothetical protein [Bacillota bacterium]